MPLNVHRQARAALDLPFRYSTPFRDHVCACCTGSSNRLLASFRHALESGCLLLSNGLRFCTTCALSVVKDYQNSMRLGKCPRTWEAASLMARSRCAGVR